MAVLPFRPTPFFADKNRAFWNLQFIGWGGALLLRSITNIANGTPLAFLVLTLIATITGFSMSLILSVIYNKLINQRPLITWSATALVLAVAVAVAALIDGWTISLWRGDSGSSFASLVLGVFYMDMTLLGAWSALYYAINYYLQVELQADRLERLEAQATSAQLAMLRYQLNPHFLFNALNAISALGYRDAARADAAISMLAELMRASLEERAQQIALKEEIAFVRLYVDLYGILLGNALQVSFDIAGPVWQAMVPTMLLQPLMENAIVHGVALLPAGGRIVVRAHIREARLVLSLINDAPADGRSAGGKGIGLSNTAERLRALYGDAHLFEMYRGARSVTVDISIPLRSESA